MIPRKFHRRLLKISPKKPVKRRVQNFLNKKIYSPSPSNSVKSLSTYFLFSSNRLKNQSLSEHTKHPVKATRHVIKSSSAKIFERKNPLSLPLKFCQEFEHIFFKFCRECKTAAMNAIAAAKIEAAISRVPPKGSKRRFCPTSPALRRWASARTRRTLSTS